MAAGSTAVANSPAGQIVEPTSGAPIAGRRSTLVDAVRGLAIGLVVLGHTSQGMSNRGLWHGWPLVSRLDGWVYSFHMPAFFFVSGLFLVVSLRKRGTWPFVRDRASALLWPYVLFETVNTFAYRSTHAVATDWRGAVWAFFTAAGSWFLPTLFFALFVFALLRRVPLWLLLPLSIAARLCWIYIPVNFASAGVFFLPYVVAGAIVGKRVQWLEFVRPWLALPLAVCFGWAVWWAVGPGQQWGHTGSMMMGCAGTLMLMLLARTVEGTRVGSALAWCGEASLGIFLLAPYLQVGMRTLLLKLHVTGSAAQLLVPSLAAVLVGAWVYQHRARLHIGWLFRYPWATQGR